MRTIRVEVRVIMMTRAMRMAESVVIGQNRDEGRRRRIGCRNRDGPAYVVEKEFAFWVEGGDEPVMFGSGRLESI